MACFTQSAAAQVVIWQEDFSGANQGWDDSNFTDADGTVNSFNGVRNDRYEVQDMEGGGCPVGGGDNNNEWISDPIDISGYCNVSISVSFGSIGPMECSSAGSPIFNCTGNSSFDNGQDQIVFYYSIDGGPLTEFRYQCGNVIGSPSATISGLSGTDLQIVIMPSNKATDEVYWFDNVRVTGILPNVNPITINPMCGGATSPLIAVGGTGTTSYTWEVSPPITTPSSGTINSSSGNISFVVDDIPGPSSEVVTLTVTPRNGACEGIPEDFTFTVNPSPSLTTDFAENICPATSVNLNSFVTDDNSTVGTVTFYNSQANANSETSPRSATVTADGTYWVRKETTAGCFDVESIDVTINPCVFCPNIAGLDAANICVGDNFTSLQAVGLEDMSAANNGVTNYGITFKAFAGADEPANPYSGGANLGSVGFGSLTGANPNQSATLTGVGSSLAENTYNICAVLSPTPATPAGCQTFSCAVVDVEACFVCPTIGSITDPPNVCAGQNFTGFTANGLSAIAQAQNGVEDYAINFEAFPGTVPPTNPYTVSGTLLGTVSLGSLTGVEPNRSATLSNVGSALPAGNYQVCAYLSPTPLDGTCRPFRCTAVTVNAGPTLATINSQSVCPGAATTAVTFSPTPAGATVNWVNNTPSIGLAANGTGNIPSFTAANSTSNPVVATISATPVSGGCSGVPRQFTITVNPTPTMDNVVGPLENCANTQVGVDFTGGPAGVTYQWTNTNTAVGLGANGTGDLLFQAPNVSTLTSANITVRPVANGCSGAAQTFALSIEPTPTLTNPGAQSVCGGKAFSLTLSGTTPGVSYQWTNNNTATGLGVDGADIIAFTAANVTAPETSLITVTPLSANCIGTDQTFNIQVNAVPTLTLGSAVCAANKQTYSFTLTTNGGIVTASGGTVTNQGGGSFLVSGVNAGVNTTVSIQGAGSCVREEIVAAPDCSCPVVNPPSNPNNPSVCSGAATPALTVTVQSGQTADWYAAPTGGTALQSNALSFTPTGVSAPGTYTFYAESRILADNCVSATRTPVVLTVNQTPTATPIPNITTCVGLTTEVAMFGSPANATLTWSNDNPGTGFPATGIGAANTTFDPLTSIVSQQVANVVVTPSLNGCTGAPIQFTITVKPRPTLSVEAVTCAPGFLTYTISVSTDAASVQSGIGVVSGGAGNFTIANIPIASSATITANNVGCVTTQVVNPPNCNCPTIDAPTNPNNPSACEGVSPVPALTVTEPPAGQTIDWFAAATGGAALASNTNTFIPSGSFPPGTYTFFAQTRETATNCVSATRTPVTLTISAIPVMNDPADQAVCSGETIATVNFTGTPGAVFNWVNDNTSFGLAASGAGSIPSFTGINNTSNPLNAFIVVTPDLNGCKGQNQFFSINVNPKPTLTVNTVTCAPDFLSYSVTVSVNFGTVTATAGTVSGSSGAFTISNIPAGTNVSIRSTTVNNCFTEQAVTAPNCNCNAPAAPAGASNLVVCNSPTLFSVAQPPAGIAIDWYATSTGGTPLQSNNASYAPTDIINAGVYTFYAESRDIAANCVSTIRTPVTLTLNLSPEMMSAAPVCAPDLQTYSVSITVVGNVTVSATAGTVSGGAGAYTVSGIPKGTNVNIRATDNTTACWRESSFIAPDCPCPTIAPPSNPVNPSACAGDAVPALSVDAPNTGLVIDWYAAATGGTALAANTNAFVPSGVTGPGTFTFFAETRDTANGCVSATRTAVVLTVNAKPSLAISAPACAVNFKSYSVGVTTNASTITATVGDVSGGNGTFTVSNIPPGVNTTIRAADATGICFIEQTVTGINCACPTIADPTGANNPTICQGAPTPALSVSAPPTGVAIDWYATAAGGTALTSGSNSFIVNQTAPGVYTFFAEARQTVSGCVSANRLPVTLTINAAPTIDPVNDISGLCGGLPVNINFTGTGNPTFNWVNTNTGIGLASSGTGNISFTTAFLSGPTTSTLTVTPSANGCLGAPRVVLISLRASPSVVAPGNLFACAQEGVSVPISGTPGATFTWTNDNTAIGLGASGTGNISFPAALVTASDTALITLTPQLNGCTGKSVTFPIIVNPLPVAAITGPLSVCVGASATIKATGGATYSWNTGAKTDAISISPINTTFFIVTVTSSAGCTKTATRSVNIAQPSPITMLESSSCNPADTGTTKQTFLNISGCDSVVVRVVKLLPRNEINLSETTCKPAEAGVFTQNLKNIFGCDSIVIRTVTFDPQLIDTTKINLTTCKPAEAGVFTQNLKNILGCDSIVIRSIAFDPKLIDTTRINLFTCDPAQAGVVQTVLTSFDGCDSVVIVTSTLRPSNTTNLTRFTCNPAEAGVASQILKNQFGCDSTVVTTTILRPSDTISLSRVTCNPANAGVFTQNLKNRFGCDSTVTTTVTLDISRRDTTVLNRTTCDPTLAGRTEQLLTNKEGCDSLVVTLTALLKSDTVRLTELVCDSSQVGITQQRLANSVGCDSLIITERVFSFAACPFTASARGDTLLCNADADGTVVFSINGGAAPFQYAWSGGGLSGSGQAPDVRTPVALEDLPTGEYTIQLTAADGKTTLVTALVAAPPALRPVINPVLRFNRYPLRCASDNNAVITSKVSGGVPPYQLRWSVPGNTADSLAGVGPGVYALSVTDANGCIDSAATSVTAPPPITVGLRTAPVECGDLSARVSVTPIGGVGPYRASVDGSPSAGGLELDVIDGTHRISVLDANGCSADTTVSVKVPLVPLVSLPADTVVNLGELFSVTALTNLSGWDSLYWTPLPDTSCPGCLTQQWIPKRSQIYKVTIVDSVGCAATSSMRLRVQPRIDLYVPNVFSPDGDGVNDLFTLGAGPSVGDLQEIRIFDRWGNMVHFWNEPLPVEQWPGWDGRVGTGSREVSLGVYVYYIVVQLANGETVAVEGDVTITSR